MRQHDVLEPILVVALRMFGVRVSSAALPALERGAYDRFAAVEQIAELQHELQRLIENAALVADSDSLVTLLVSIDRRERLAQTGFVAIEPHLLVHHDRELEAQAGRSIAGVGTLQ